MPDDIRDILVEIIDSYGIKILEDPDRLAQFLEDRSSLRPEDTFHLTFALRFLLKCGWRPSRREYMKEGADYRASLESQLGFTKEQAAEVMKLINWLMEMEYGGSKDEAETEAVVAVPGNLKKIAGGVANRPRTMRIRKKSLYNGIILIVSLAVLAALFFQIGNQRTPTGDELRIAFLRADVGPRRAAVACAAQGGAACRRARQQPRPCARRVQAKGHRLRPARGPRRGGAGRRERDEG